MIKQLKGHKAQYGGDDVKNKNRVFGVAHYNTVDNQQGPAFDVLKKALSDGGVKLAAEQEFQLDIARGQEQARTIISKMKSAGVTTIIFTGDPLTPVEPHQGGDRAELLPRVGHRPERARGHRAVRSHLRPGPVAARLRDPAHRRTRERERNESYTLYRWFTGHTPENNTYGVILADLADLVTGIHLAGPDLTPDSFAKAPPTGAGQRRHPALPAGVARRARALAHLRLGRLGRHRRHLVEPEGPR